MISTEFRTAFEYVPGKTRTREMTDGEISRELATATGKRLDALKAEIADRERLRASEDQAYALEPLLAGAIFCHWPRYRRPDSSCDERRNCVN